MSAVPEPGEAGGGLEGGSAPAADESTHSPGWFARHRRRIVVWLLVTVAALILLIGSLTVWVKRQLLEPEAWTNASTELIQNEDIQVALATALSDRLIERGDIQARLEERLPPIAQPLAGPIAGLINQNVQPAALRLVQSPRIQTLFEGIVTRASTTLIAVLEGNEGGRVTTTGGQVVLDLNPLLQRLSDRLGLDTEVSPEAGQIVLMQADRLEAAQKAVRVIKALTVFLAIIVLVLLALAFYLARGFRREVLRGVGASFIIIGVLVLVVRRLAGNAVVDAITSGGTEAAGNATWLIATDMLRDLATALLGYGIFAVIGAWLAGPTRWAVGIRRALAPTFRNRVALVYGAVFLLFLVILLFGPAGESRQWIGILVLGTLIVLGVELLRRQTLREFPAAEPEAPSAPPPVREAPA